MILAAYVLPHPPLAVPAVGRGREEEIKGTLSALSQAAQEIASHAPETIIVITPHSTVYADYFHISPGELATGDLSRFGAFDTQMELKYDRPLALEIARCAAKFDIPAGEQGERDPSLDHGVTVPLHFINQAFNNYKLVRIAQSGMSPAGHYRFGQAIAKAAKNIGRSIVLIASGDLSHKLSAEGPYGFAKEGPEFDKNITQILASGDFPGLFKIPEALRENAAECGYNSIMVLAGCLDGQQVKPALLSYEGPFGVGYAVASFKPKKEGPYQVLARQSLEHAVAEGTTLPLPDNLPEEMLNRKAGVFVSLHINGQLRGCIGTIAPTTDSIAGEIIQNAVSAGLNDFRFNPVTTDELPLLTYKVDVLAQPEVIADASQLDVKRYGVIVTSGPRRGLLLPNLDGIDTVEQQIAIASGKAGIPPGAQVQLERFEVVRHG